MEEKCYGQLGKPRKRRRSKGNSASTDRLSDLPDCILYHILSFVETIDAVKTSVLSRRWRCVWKYVPVLDVKPGSFRGYRRFVRFVNKVLSLRYQVKVNEISMIDYSDYLHLDLYHKVIQYAISHDTQHLAIALNVDFKFADLFGSTMYCDLQTLELRCIYFDIGHSCFQKVTTLKLDSCPLNLIPIEGDHLDLSVNFPRLMNLDIYDCNRSEYDGTRIKISAPQLLNLRLAGYEQFGIEIVAPRLKFFGLEFISSFPFDYLGFPDVTLPYTDRAEVSVDSTYFRHKRLDLDLDTCYLCLLNAKSIVLRCDTVKECKKFRKFLELKLSSFTKLESLVCVSNNPSKVVNFSWPTEVQAISDAVINYFASSFSC